MHCHRFPGPKKEWLCNFLDCSKLPPCYTNFIIISYHRQHQYSPKSRWIRNINMCVSEAQIYNIKFDDINILLSALPRIRPFAKCLDQDWSPISILSPFSSPMCQKRQRCRKYFFLGSSLNEMSHLRQMKKIQKLYKILIFTFEKKTKKRYKG